MSWEWADMSLDMEHWTRFLQTKADKDQDPSLTFFLAFTD